MAPLPLDEYHIGIICALHVELAAVQATLDEEHGTITDQDVHDHNAYLAGRIHQHDIVIACLPAGIDGVSAAATVAKDMLRTFPQLYFGLLVGIGGGIPDIEAGVDIRLGDVVVSQPKGIYGGVVQYDKGKSISGKKWERKGMLNAPPQVLLTAVQSLQARHELEDSKIGLYLTQMLERWPRMSKLGYAFPGSEKDILYNSNGDAVVPRDARDTFQPVIHYGTIVSGNRVIKDALERDSLRHEYGALCVEMEAAGLVNNFPCLVVRGICDYADAHKNDDWHRYAAVSAAAFVKELLLHVPLQHTRQDKSTLQMLKMMDQTRDMQLVETLVHVGGAAHKSYDNRRHRQCLEGTRVDVLQRITSWVTQKSAQYIFWLRGRAGTGKSTVALTVAQLLDEQDVLMASFFFKRGGGDLASFRKVIGTIAFQLTTQSHQLRSIVYDSIRGDPDVTTSASVPEQFDKLLVQPLHRLKENMTKPYCVLIILDALDECDDADDVRLFLKLLGNVGKLADLGLRVLLTSRPEIPIRLEFHSMEHVAYYDLALHDVPRMVVDHDIELFVSHELSRIRHERRLPAAWPGIDKIQEIVTRADGLFIYAATICLYVDGPWQISPARRLEQVCQGSMRKHKSTEALNSMYLVILDSSLKGDFAGDEIEESIEQLRHVMGTVVVLFDNLSADAIAHLLFPTMSDGGRMIQQTLDPLHAIFNVPEDIRQPIQALHLSFRDFLVDGTQCRDVRFQIDQKSVHHDLAIKCIDIMMRSLKRNVCRPTSPCTLADDIPVGVLSRFLTEELRYACSHWIEHLGRGCVELSDNGPVHAFLRKHAIHWLEVMSLIKKMPEATALTSKLELLIKPQETLVLLPLVHDMYRFMRTFNHVITEAPLQLYSSGLLFSPTSSVFRQCFGTETYQNIEVQTQLPTHWTACTHVFERRSGLAERWALDHRLETVGQVAFSSDGTRLVSSSNNGVVKTWDVQTGRRLYMAQIPPPVAVVRLAVRNGIVWAVASSNDGLLAIWSTQTGQQIRALGSLSIPICAVAISGDCSQIASATIDDTVRLWDTRTGHCQHILRSQIDFNPSSTVVFSPDGTLLITASCHETLAWDTQTGACHYAICAPIDPFNIIPSIAFSADSSQAARGSYCGSLTIWNAQTGHVRYLFQIPSEYPYVHNVVFSPDGSRVICSSDQGLLYVWDLYTGQLQHLLKGNTASLSVMIFSPGGSQAASGSDDGAVRVWDVQSGECRLTLEGHTGRIDSIAFSPDGTQLASSSRDDTVRLWDITTPRNLSILESRSRNVKRLLGAPDASRVIAEIADDMLQVWNVKTLQCHHTLKGHTACIESIAFSSDWLRIVTGSIHKTFRTWNIQTGQCLGIFRDPIGTIHTNRLLLADTKAVIVKSNYVLLWDLETDQYQVYHTGFTNKSQPVLSPNGTSAVWSEGHRICVWNTRTGAFKEWVQDETFQVSALIVPNPMVFLNEYEVASTKRTMGITYSWNTETGTITPLMADECAGVLNTVISVDGSRLLSVTQDWVIRVWDLKSRSCLLNCTVELGSRHEPIQFSDDSQSVVVGEKLIPILAERLLSRGGLVKDPIRSSTLLRKSLTFKDNWVYSGSDRLLWIPPEYRPQVHTVVGDALVLASAAGRMTVVRHIDD